MLKDVAGQHIGCQLTNKTDGSPVTSGTTDVYKIEANGTQTLAANTPATHEGNGWWSYSPAQNETDSAHVAFTFVNSSAVVATVQVWPLDLSQNASFQQSIVDGVWDEAASGHTAGVSMGGVLGNVPTAAENADAVWDEARSGHVAAGSFGEGAASVQGNVTGSVGSVTGAVGSVTGNVGGNVAGSVASVTAGVTLAADAVTAAAVAADAGTEIAAAVAANLEATHGAGSWEGGGGLTEASIAAEVDSVLSASHGAGAWGGALTGTYALVLHTQTSGAVTIPETRITIRDETDTTVLRVLDTDSAGDVGVALDAGTYLLHVRKAGHSFADPITMIVSADATVNVEGEVIVPATPSAGGCTVYGYMQDLGLVAHSGVKVIATILKAQAVNGVILTTKVKTTSSNGAGYWEMELPQEAEVRIQIGAALVTHVFEVPADTTYDFSEEFE